MTNKLFKTAILATTAAAFVAATMVPELASAQSRYTPSYGTSYDESGQYYYDGCARDQTNRAVVGGATGAVAGAVIGNSLVNKRRDSGGGAIVGGVLGALIGSSIGQSTAACQPEPKPQVVVAPPRQPQRTYRYAPPPAPVYEDRRYSYNDDYDQSYAPPPPPAAKPQCTYVEDAIRMPDGALSKRMVRVCQDSNGQYQIVQ